MRVTHLRELGNVELSALPKGLYLLRIGGENVNFTGKFSKE